MFRLKKWDDPQTFKHNRFNDAHAEPQDILQVWFAGVHADIGGGYPEKESGLSKYPLLWMIDEATKCGLQVNQATVNQLAWGIQRKGSPFSYVVPDVRGDLHTSLSGAWWILEYIPKSANYKEWPARKSLFRLLHLQCRTALHSRRRHHAQIRAADGLRRYRGSGVWNYRKLSRNFRCQRRRRTRERRKWKRMTLVRACEARPAITRAPMVDAQLPS